MRSSPAGHREAERLIDRLDPPPELAPFDRPQRLGRSIAVGENDRSPGPIPESVSPGRTLTDKRERIPPRDLERGLALVEHEMGPLRPARARERNEQPRQGDPDRRGRQHDQGRRRPAAPPTPASSARITGLGSITSRKSIALASSTALRTVASRSAGEPIAIVAGIHAQELDRARQPIVQARPPLLDPQRDVEIGKPDDQRPDDPLDTPARSPPRRAAARSAARITESRWNSQSARPARITSGTIRPSTQESPCSASSRLSELRSPLIRDSSCEESSWPPGSGYTGRNVEMFASFELGRHALSTRS